ncbi:hypothetical protein FQN54_005288 [Arachnomyces sp. PD_36]|nr:hypothetical protein FQN54_005288 [Arachnomyces sp. PD_36]
MAPRVNQMLNILEVQLKLVRSIAHILDEEHQKIQNETLELLAVKLKIAVGSIESVMESTPSGNEKDKVRRWKYALVQQKIDKAIQDLELWQQMFDPSWYLIMKAATPQIDAELRSYERVAATDTHTHTTISSAQSLRSALDTISANKVPIFLPENGLDSLQLHDIPLSSATIGRREDHTKSLILERFKPGINVRQVEKDVRDLARKLANSSALEFGLLNCKGVIKHGGNDSTSPGPTAFTVVFRVPPGFSQPRSLRSCLQDMKETDSLSDRFRLANELARSVSYVHTFGFVHKNIRPETILLLTNEESSIGSAFLIGFDNFRAADGKTLHKIDSAWERCLYQHPSRMGVMPTEDHAMQHDIYSLGVCLLELGLWESFVSYDDKYSYLPNDGRSTNATRTATLGADVLPLVFKDRLLSLARGPLRRRMGSKYSEVVVTCLTCLDPGNTDFGDENEFQDADGIQVGVRYIEKVTMRLNNISA